MWITFIENVKSEDGETILYKKGYKCDVNETWAAGMVRKGYAIEGKHALENVEADVEIVGPEGSGTNDGPTEDLTVDAAPAPKPKRKTKKRVEF